MQAFVLLLALAIATEGIIEYLGMPLPSIIKPYVAALLAVVLCVGFEADLFFILGLPAAYPFVGPILTGLIIGRGSNYLNDIISRLGLIRTPAASVDAVERRNNAIG